MILTVCVYWVLSVQHITAVSAATTSLRETNLSDDLINRFNIDLDNSRVIRPHKAVFKSKRWISFSFAATPQALTSIHKMTLHYMADTKRRIASIFWTDVYFSYNTTRAFIGRQTNRKVEGGWWKLRIPKRKFKDLSQSHTANSTVLSFDLDLKGPGRNWEPHNLNQTVLSIEMVEPATNIDRCTTASVTPSAQTVSAQKPVIYNKCMGNCCLQPLVVNFDEIHGYDWILSPRRYIANYCAGSCSTRYMSPLEASELPVQSRIVESFLAKQNLAKTALSCVEGSKKPLRMIYRDSRGIVRTSNSTLSTITACKCR